MIECQLGYLMMLISNGICQYDEKYAAEQKYFLLFGTIPIFRKKFSDILDQKWQNFD